MQRKRAVLYWSGGKDCAYSLYLLNKQKKYSVDCLCVTLSGKGNRVSIHGVDRSLIENQAESIGIPVIYNRVPENSSNREYEEAQNNVMRNLKQEGIRYAVFGDIYLDEIRKYRVKLFKKLGMETHFPLWEMDSQKIAEDFIETGFKAKISCVNGSKLDISFAGREYNHQFISDLPKEADPCGENGEFHTFVYDGPVFRSPLSVHVGITSAKQIPSPVQGAENIIFYYPELSLLN